MLNYTDITQNTYIQSSTDTEITYTPDWRRNKPKTFTAHVSQTRCWMSAPLYERMHILWRQPIAFNDRIVWFPGTGTAMTFTHDYSNTVAIVSISDFICRNSHDNHIICLMYGRCVRWQHSDSQYHKNVPWSLQSWQWASWTNAPACHWPNFVQHGLSAPYNSFPSSK